MDRKYSYTTVFPEGRTQLREENINISFLRIPVMAWEVKDALVTDDKLSKQVSKQAILPCQQPINLTIFGLFV